MYGSKRSRAAFEADLQAQQSPYVFFGTPLPPLDPSVRDDGSYVPVWKQEVTDERGRKRLHGAFTGGFSAGYFNTVGSKEGWTPSSFVSTRQNRAKDRIQQRPEDFMDEEDLREAEEAKTLQTSEAFAGFRVPGQASARDGLMDLFKSEGETMGVKLMKRMGWREGQGVGPKVRRRANLGDDGFPGEESAETHLFAPPNPPMVAFVRKLDHKGLGFEGEARLGSGDDNQDDADDDDSAADPFFGRLATHKKPKDKPPARRGGIGVGVLNDTGSDDEDAYTMGPQISYNRTIGGNKKKRKKAKATSENKPAIGLSNPLLSSKPVFISKKSSLSSVRKCHDGRLPLDGFVLADAVSSLSLTSGKTYDPPKIPEGWKPSRTASTATPGDSGNYVSTADAAKASTLDPKSRAEILGETPLPGQSIFDWMTPEARERIVKLTGKTDLPPALGKKAPKGFEMSEAEKRKDLWNLVPKLEKATAVQALNRAIGGWMPYAEDESKRARYRTFLEISAGLKDGLPDRAPGASTDDWVMEMREFARAAEVFKPISGLMASRFTSASSAPQATSETPDSSVSTDQLLSRPAPKPADPAEEAAKIGMFGPMTRSTQPFFPTRLLCKRFNVKPPAREQPEQGESGASSRLALVSQDVMDQLMAEPGSAAAPEGGTARERVVIEPERNEALEAERPGEAVFKAIFGSDEEDEGE
ncbi:hypothetical protein VTN31DRAFT_6211 [Thermomyces dupontii]|uniref:uncharacterized protein n=1 Tax=Talaromyces thermophilus TaxID=28565 RepID=UPI0037438CE9